MKMVWVDIMTIMFLLWRSSLIILMDERKFDITIPHNATEQYITVSD